MSQFFIPLVCFTHYPTHLSKEYHLPHAYVGEWVGIGESKVGRL
ncbi:hypothetical protein BF9343_2822 [Bacteroides fragilis NCTC 9343]|uniref:Uncharacterized protein n=1 Tax=Bacteroides fragilis (strain ATCC 25285 / DSM 2151 / CCUG 4856 / JCM 11019 / LMG 10263 / NCTC 9343 / Onslow / VPI 2553 / EN-2) TaxID=272559 RepID=Q5LBB7_BACFN|nr:hypothetical protein BF9343_2822 [Bacteroides fragilis NCTC 9343]